MAAATIATTTTMTTMTTCTSFCKKLLFFFGFGMVTSSGLVEPMMSFSL